jgi:type IV pilus assembly protein PilN
MIRINLLPIKQDRRREAVRNQLLLGVVILIIEVGVFAFMYMNLGADIQKQENVNSGIESDVRKIRQQIQDHQQILNEIQEFEKRQAAIDGLMEARTGPVHVMLELSNILSKRGRPNIDKAAYDKLIRLDPTAGYDEDWDYRRLWISKLSEKSKSVIIEGQALTHEDVAEFLRRLNLSRFFVTSELISTDLGKVQLNMPGIKEAKTDPVVHFKINATVRYR